jgi:hypothetical protein
MDAPADNPNAARPGTAEGSSGPASDSRPVTAGQSDPGAFAPQADEDEFAGGQMAAWPEHPVGEIVYHSEEMSVPPLSPYSEDPVQKLRNSTCFILPEDPNEDNRVRNHQFSDWLEEDRRHSLNCRTLPLTMLTWFAFIFVAWCHGNIDDTYRMQRCLSGAIHEIKAHHTVSGIGQSTKSVVNLTTATSVDKMWSWVEGGLVPAMAGSPTKPGFVRTFNQVIGQIQLRETRFQDGKCQVGQELANFYRQGCHTPGAVSVAPFGVQSGNDTDRAFLAAWGQASKFSDTNAERFLTWLDIGNPETGSARANELRTAKWVDDGSKLLELHIALFNAEIQAYGLIHVKLILERGGRIKVNMEVRSLWAVMYTEWWHYVGDIIWALCVMKFIANSVQRGVDNTDAPVYCHGECSCCPCHCRCCEDKAIFACCFCLCRRRNCKGCRLTRCCTLPKAAGGGMWLALDWIGILLALGMMSFLLIFASGFTSLASKVGGLGVMQPGPLFGNETWDDLSSWNDRYGTYYASNAEIIEDIEHLIQMKIIHRLLMFWYAMVFLFRWYKGFRGQARIAQITETLASALADLVHFAIISLVLFVNFALAGHVLFGHEVAEWSTIPRSLQSCLGMAWGRVDYQPLHDIAPISAAIWLSGYVISIVMISMNMLLAIIMDHYGGVFHANNAGDKGYDIFGQTKMMINEGVWNTLYVIRWLYRILYDLFPRKVRNFRFTPYFPEEQTRVQIPYDELYWVCQMDPLGFMTEHQLQKSGCDPATAAHIMRKCEDEVLRHLPEVYPLEQLFDEFDESMKQYYFAMDTFSNELRSWFAEKSTAAGRMLPRAKKLDDVSKTIEVAKHIEHVHHHHHSAQTLEGEGAHHHRHRRLHNDDEAEVRSYGTHSNSHSHANSRSQSGAPSRSASKY